MSKTGKNYEVGYGKPPKRTQFPKGSSGNPKGRPKGDKNLFTIVQRAVRERVTVKTQGRTIRMSKLEACMHQLANKAASGDLKAIREFLYWSQVFAGFDKDSELMSTFSENDKPVIESILSRLRQTSPLEVITGEAAMDLEKGER